MHDKHQKIKSLLDDEDIYQMITEYFWNIDCDIIMDKFKIYVKQEVFSSVRIENKKSILNTIAWIQLKHFS